MKGLSRTSSQGYTRLPSPHKHLPLSLLLLCFHFSLFLSAVFSSRRSNIFLFLLNFIMFSFSPVSSLSPVFYFPFYRFVFPSIQGFLILTSFHRLPSLPFLICSHFLPSRFTVLSLRYSKVFHSYSASSCFPSLVLFCFYFSPSFSVPFVSPLFQGFPVIFPFYGFVSPSTQSFFSILTPFHHVFLLFCIIFVFIVLLPFLPSCLFIPYLPIQTQSHFLTV